MLTAVTVYDSVAATSINIYIVTNDNMNNNASSTPYRYRIEQNSKTDNALSTPDYSTDSEGGTIEILLADGRKYTTNNYEH